MARATLGRLVFAAENATHWLADHHLMPKRLQRWICDRYEYSIWVNGGCEIGGVQMADFYTEAEREEIWRTVRRDSVRATGAEGDDRRKIVDVVYARARNGLQTTDQQITDLITMRETDLAQFAKAIERAMSEMKVVLTADTIARPDENRPSPEEGPGHGR